MNLYWLLAFVAGSSIAIQAAMNAWLGQLLNSSFLATSYAFLTSFIFVSIVMFAAQPQTGSGLMNTFKLALNDAPWYLWLSFVLSVLGVTSFYFLIPRLGVGNVMSFALAGQLIAALIIGHFGWFASPVKVISFTKILGAVLLIAGMLLINKEVSA